MMNLLDTCVGIPGASALIGLEKVARMLDTSLRTVQRLIAAGELPRPIKVGKLARLQVQDVLEFVERQKQRCRGKG